VGELGRLSWPMWAGRGSVPGGGGSALRAGGLSLCVVKRPGRGRAAVLRTGGSAVSGAVALGPHNACGC